MKNSIDILMITHRRSYYTQLSLKRLLDTCDDSMRVWIWQNGNDKETIEVVKSFQGHPRFFKYYHSSENKKLNEPTNWLWENSDAGYFSKVDDDCVVPYGWANVLRKAHYDIPKLGIVGCWHFHDEDFNPELANKKIQSFKGGHKLLRNCWVGGSAYLIKRECFEILGPLTSKQSFTSYCLYLAKMGYIIGWYYPFLYQEHLDDPRCPDSMIKQDCDIRKFAPLSAINNGVSTVDAWQAQLKRSAHNVQRAPFDPKYYFGWRGLIKRIKVKLKKSVGIKQLR